tara:strand:+ start:4475 stop:5170 length:696 start_codon:yes stop_codon:yes gene_type:complete
MIWWILPAAVGFFGLVIVLTGLARLGKRKVRSGGFRLVSGGMVLTGATLMSLVGLNLQSYSRLTLERPVATVELTQVEAQRFQATVLLEGEDVPVTYDVRGDEIEFKARIIKWTPWANMIGYDAVYKLDRMAGQYTNIDEDLAKPRTVYPLHDDRGINAFDLVRKRGGWLKAVDAYYGSGTYIPMLNGAKYEIIMTQNGLISRAGNPAATEGLKNWQPPANTIADVAVEAG